MDMNVYLKELPAKPRLDILRKILVYGINEENKQVNFIVLNEILLPEGKIITINLEETLKVSEHEFLFEVDVNIAKTIMRYLNKKLTKEEAEKKLTDFFPEENYNVKLIEEKGEENV